MKAFVITKFGPPEVLQVRELPVPEPNDDEVRIRVKAIGLNFADVMARLGVYPSIPDPPFVPGIELAGVVETAGKGVSDLKPGTHVAGFSKQGAYAEFVCLKPSALVVIPPSMSFENAAAFLVTYLTAYHGMITLGNIRSRERMLLHAAAGGVGTAALQIARHLNVEVFATASSSEKIAVAKEHGAAWTINYQEEDFAEAIHERTNGYGVDVVMDSVGGHLFRRGWKLLAPMGRYILYGFAAVSGNRTINKFKALKEFLSVPPLYPPTIVSQNKSFAGFNLYFLAHKTEYVRSALATILEWYRQGVIQPVIGRSFSFDRMAEAHEFIQSRKSIGKVVITVP